MIMIDLICKIAPKSAQLSSLVCLNETYLAYAIDFLFVEFVEYQRHDAKSVKLELHQEPVKCMHLAKSDLLCSCSVDLVIIWNLSQIKNAKITNGKVVGRDCLQYEPRSCCFNVDQSRLAVCHGVNLTIFDTKSCTRLCEIVSKEYLNFIKYDQRFLIVVTQMNSLSVYDSQTSKQIQSINDSFVNITSCDNKLLANTSEGYLHLYESKDQFSLIKKINLNEIYKTSSVDNHPLCIGLKMFTVKNEASLSKSTTENLIACVGTSNGVYIIDLDSCNLVYQVSFSSLEFVSLGHTLLPQEVEFCVFGEHNEINIALSSLLQNEIHVVRVVDLFVKSKINSAESWLSVVPSEPLTENSPLFEKVLNKEVAKSHLPSMQDFVKTKKLGSLKQTLNKPVVFNSRIKSSGYTVTPPKPTSVTKKTSLSLSNLRLDSSKSVKSSQAGSSSNNLLNFQFKLPVNLSKRVDSATDNSSPIVLASFSDDGQNLAIASNDNLIQYLPANQLDKLTFSFRNHKEKINTIDISHDCRLLLSASEDRTCKLWSLKKTVEPLLLDISSLKMKEPNASYQFKKGIAAASFFYLDKFLLIGVEKSLLLCKYHIDTTKNDVQRYLNSSFCKLITKLDLTFAQNISTLTAINSFYSYLVFCGGTDKSIEIFDMNQAKSCLTIHEAHTRPFHQICLNKSEFNQSSYDLFMTNSLVDGIKLWDLRIASCVQKLDAHISRSVPSKASFSPDSNYVAVGSEDKSTVVYDLRMNGVTQKYGVFSETVSCAQFNPRRSQTDEYTVINNRWAYHASPYYARIQHTFTSYLDVKRYLRDKQTNSSLSQ